MTTASSEERAINARLNGILRTPFINLKDENLSNFELLALIQMVENSVDRINPRIIAHAEALATFEKGKMELLALKEKANTLLRNNPKTPRVIRSKQRVFFP